MTVAVLCGGVGAARFLRGLVRVVDPATVTAVVNVADDCVVHGLHVSPDIDTCIYTLADAIDPDRGWGLRDETWQAAEGLARYGNPTWFNLGDRDLATHIVRTERLGRGSSLSAVTADLATAWGLRTRILPVTDDPVRTELDTEVGRLSFQEYFVRHRHDVAVRAVHLVGADTAVPAAGVIEAVEGADSVVIAPSNPIVSIGPILAVPGVRHALSGRRDTSVAVSPIIAGAALKGPADRMLAELGHDVSVVGIAHLYAPLAATLVIDDADADLADAVRAAGMEPLVTDTIMADPVRAAALASTTIHATGATR